MGKVLGIDYGTKRTGIAITDMMQIIATGLTTINTYQLDNFIEDILKKEDIECIVIGEPKSLNGSTTNSTAHVNSFVKRLKNKHPSTPIYFIDERYTSKIAKKSILASGIRKEKRKDKFLIDKVSATIILQDFLYYRS